MAFTFLPGVYIHRVTQVLYYVSHVTYNLSTFYSGSNNAIKGQKEIIGNLIPLFNRCQQNKNKVATETKRINVQGNNKENRAAEKQVAPSRSLPRLLLLLAEDLIGRGGSDVTPLIKSSQQHTRGGANLRIS